MKTHGDERWRSFPSYLPIVIPRVLEFLRERKLKITFFIVGQDAVLPHNSALLQSLADEGHEIANHSFKHEPWLHEYSKTEIEQEIVAAENAIEEATGSKPKGFRGPGYSLSDTVLEVLASRGYLYDASTFPTFLGPLARAYYFLTAKLNDDQKRQRARLFGSIKDGFRPLRPYRWRTRAGLVPELPVTTVPILRTPFHLSYLIYLSKYSIGLSQLYLRMALLLCKWTVVTPSFLLHPLDFIGPSEAPELAFFPGMDLVLERKLAVADSAIRAIQEKFSAVPMSQHILDALVR